MQKGLARPLMIVALNIAESRNVFESIYPAVILIE